MTISLATIAVGGVYFTSSPGLAGLSVLNASWGASSVFL